ncbi:uncharacterized protein TNCV_1969711 [Trichonephila clavipes]|nr:uncharacterized protein TNCV_1969711 [Trichonephila clavipes]
MLEHIQAQKKKVWRRGKETQKEKNEIANEIYPLNSCRNFFESTSVCTSKTGVEFVSDCCLYSTQEPLQYFRVWMSSEVKTGHDSLVVKVVGSWLACQKFEPSTTKDPPWERCTLNLSKLKRPSGGMGWKLGKGGADTGVIQIFEENNTLAFPPWDIPIFNYSNPFSGYHKAGTAAVIYQQLFSYHRSKYSKYIPVYTDGSKTAGHVGCGVVFNNTILSFSLHNSMSVFSAELTVILVALQHILISNHRHFCVYTDSMSALESLHLLTEHRHPTVIEILLRKLERKGFDIIFSWVPGHVGILGNEQADNAARSMSDHMQQPLSLLPGFKNLYTELYPSYMARNLGSTEPQTNCIVFILPHLIGQHYQCEDMMSA